jgi:hypothetical protein
MGRVAMGVDDAEAVVAGGAGAAGGTNTAAGGAAGRGGTTTDGGTGGAAERSAGGTIVGRGATGDATTGAAITGADGAAGAAGGATAAGTGRAGIVGAATTGLATTGGGATARGGAATASFCCVIAFSTSPGREMFDRSILVLISSSPRNGRADLAVVDCASDEPRMWARTFTASCSSIELECVFFSVTPTATSASRMALLLTSSSLARSLIRTLLIRPFLAFRVVLTFSSQPHGVSFLDSHATEKKFARAMVIQFFPEPSLPAHALRSRYFRARRAQSRPQMQRGR